jgi:hypothetical protein
MSAVMFGGAGGTAGAFAFAAAGAAAAAALPLLPEVAAEARGVRTTTMSSAAAAGSGERRIVVASRVGTREGSARVGVSERDEWQQQPTLQQTSGVVRVCDTDTVS